jgi:hypothetical protein
LDYLFWTLGFGLFFSSLRAAVFFLKFSDFFVFPRKIFFGIPKNARANRPDYILTKNRISLKTACAQALDGFLGHKTALALAPRPVRPDFGKIGSAKLALFDRF